MFFTKAIAAAIIFAAHAASQKAISLCGNPNFSACENVQYTINRCVNLTGFTRQTANSLDTYGATCRFYIADQCNAGSQLNEMAIIKHCT
ncbi:hypothetical protein LZ554_003225 [Drepanopeziza brunnea f. sp. 'monogermtubi']|nr:hypothetical protein LZ554_003225 [Drepanopeziza brunnea f. sp. 'monogermtubi']